MRQDEQRSRKFAKSLRGRMTNAEIILWSRLRRGGVKGARFRRQHPFGPFVVDFACVTTRIVLEIDGATHSTNTEISYDKRRERFLAAKGWCILRVTNTDIYENLDGVMDAITTAVPPPRQMADLPRKRGRKDKL